MKYVSGIRPSGLLHLGNYLGVIKTWKQLQDNSDCFFFIADMHGQYSKEDINTTLKQLHKCGINKVELQSDYRHGLLDLFHELSFYSNTSRLDNMTQYKEKGGTLSLYSYPVLMAADILFHKATHVPIGDDQKQHLELVRELARKTNRVVPEAVVDGNGMRVMGLKDPTKKMSKSDLNDNQRINLSDSKDTIAYKIWGAATSNNVGDNTPASDNLMKIYSAVGGKNNHTLWSSFKDELIDLLAKELNK